MTDLDMANAWVKALLQGLPENTREELRSIVSRRSAPPPTGDAVKVLIYHHVRQAARTAGIRDDPFVIADAIRSGDLPLDA